MLSDISPFSRVSILHQSVFNRCCCAKLCCRIYVSILHQSVFNLFLFLFLFCLCLVSILHQSVFNSNCSLCIMHITCVSILHQSVFNREKMKYYLILESVFQSYISPYLTIFSLHISYNTTKFQSYISPYLTRYTLIVNPIKKRVSILHQSVFNVDLLAIRNGETRFQSYLSPYLTQYIKNCFRHSRIHFNPTLVRI